MFILSWWKNLQTKYQAIEFEKFGERIWDSRKKELLRQDEGTESWIK